MSVSCSASNVGTFHPWQIVQRPNANFSLSLVWTAKLSDRIKLMTFKLEDQPVHIQLQRYIKISFFSTESGTDKH